MEVNGSLGIITSKSSFFVDASTSITVIKKLLEIVQSVAVVEHGPYIE